MAIGETANLSSAVAAAERHGNLKLPPYKTSSSTAVLPATAAATLNTGEGSIVWRMMTLEQQEAAAAATEGILAIKKRRRMDKRREYEEEVQRELQDSSESSDTCDSVKPGKPVTLDQVLSFTKTARFVQNTYIHTYIHIHI